MRRIINPYFCYASSFLAALLIYSFGWSDLYPELSFALIIFILATIGIHILLGIQLARKNVTQFTPIKIRTNLYPILFTIFIYVLWAVEFLYEGGIPLLKILMGEPFNYRVFGVPSLHVFIVTFSSFYTIFLFHLYLSARSYPILALYLINLGAALLIYNRGMLLFNVSASVFLYLMTMKKFYIRHVFATGLGIILVLYFFGVLGSLRSSREGNAVYSNDDFLLVGHASNSFRNSFVPNEFLWSYIYITSPLANLQQNTATYPVKPLTFTSFLYWGNNEILPDFISKRINSFLGKERIDEHRISETLNASTIYCRSFSYLGWPGVVLMGLLILILPFLFFKVIPASSPFFLTAFSIVNTLFFFMIFENTLRFTGLSFQLVYPFFLNLVLLRFPKLREIFA